MLEIKGLLDDFSLEDKYATQHIVEVLRARSVKFIRVWNETPAPLWLSVAIEDHKARIATYDYMLMVLELGRSSKDEEPFGSIDVDLPDHYEGTQYVENCSLDVVLAFAKAYLLSGHDVVIVSVPNTPDAAQGTTSYKIVYKK